MEDRKLVLNKKNTFKIAFAFFGILMLWQAYNFYCPLILKALLSEIGVTDNNFIVGIMMALDNVVAIIIMPIVGRYSDRTKSKWGKRMPYIVIGMLLSIIVFPLIALMCLWNSLVGVIIFMLLFLVIMQAYRSPAVAFMPDITPKPLRSTANGIINLIGYLGGVFVAVMGMLPMLKLTSDSSLSQIQHVVLWPFIICTFIMIGVLIFLVLTVKENKMLEDSKDDVLYGEQLSETEEIITENQQLSKKDHRNFLIILIAIFFWFMSFNSFETFGSSFGKDVLNDTGVISTMTTVLTVISIVSFIAFANLANKIGRKWTVVIGLILLIVALSMIAGVTLIVDFSSGVGSWRFFFIGMACLMGIGWALININSFPMIVEYSNPSNIGKYTGYYYMSSMLAQSITPILVGLIMDDPFNTFGKIGLKVLFIYASFMMIVALIIFFMVKEKITLKERRLKASSKKKALESLGDID